MLSLDLIRIVLVEPAGPLNVGSVARVMKNMGLRQLVLVNPHCDPQGPEARQMAVHGGDLLDQVQIVPDLPRALVGCDRAIATSGRVRKAATILEPPAQVLPWLLMGDRPAALIFGPEDRGLNNEELNYAQRFLGIPADPAYSSLNLAQAVAVCVYELYQIHQQPRPQDTSPIPLPPGDPASLEAIEGYCQHLENLLLDIGFLLPHTRAARMEKFRRLMNRANLRAEELALLRGMLRQGEWALGQRSPQTSNPSSPQE